MANIIKTTKRQIEILTLVLQNPNMYNIMDIEGLFSIKRATVERDMLQIRSWGIDLHSIRGNFCVVTPVTPQKYVELLSMYIAFSSSQSVFHKSLALIHKSLKDKSLSTFIIINKAIDESIVMQFTYYNLQSNKKEQRTINPYGLTLIGKRWLLLGYVNEYKQIRHYLVENISDPVLLNKHFRLDRKFDLAKYYENTWGRWHSEKTQNVKIWFDKSVAHIVENRYWHVNQKVKKQKDGSVIFEANVSGLNEITNWILPWGKLAKVIEPEELSKRVKKIAEEILTGL